MTINNNKNNNICNECEKPSTMKHWDTPKYQPQKDLKQHNKLAKYNHFELTKQNNNTSKYKKMVHLQSTADTGKS